MTKEIKINMNVIESMLYFWTATSEKEKISEKYIIELSEQPEMKLLYGDEFNGESIRKVLSAITNREKLNGSNQKERQFWNNNMWMLEDLDYMQSMVAPIKVLNLDSLVEEMNEIKEIPYESLEVVFIPANKEEFIVKDNKLILNFFKITPDVITFGEPTINGKVVKEYIKNTMIENF